MYKVFAGSFKSRENAQERVVFLRSKGIQSFIVATTIQGETLVSSTGRCRGDAETRVTEIKAKTGINAFITTDNVSSTSSIPSTAPRSIDLKSILNFRSYPTLC